DHTFAGAALDRDPLGHVARVNLGQRAGGPTAAFERDFAADLAAVELVASPKLVIETRLRPRGCFAAVHAQVQVVGDVEVAVAADQLESMVATLAQQGTAVEFRGDDIQ